MISWANSVGFSCKAKLKRKYPCWNSKHNTTTNIRHLINKMNNVSWIWRRRRARKIPRAVHPPHGVGDGGESKYWLLCFLLLQQRRANPSFCWSGENIKGFIYLVQNPQSAVWWNYSYALCHLGLNTHFYTQKDIVNKIYFRFFFWVRIIF